MADGSNHPEQRIMFDEYVSLGYNCEVAFQLRRIQGFDNAHFFNWNITEPEQLAAVLDADFAGVMDDTTPHNGLMRDGRYGFHFHGAGSKSADRGKADHLISKFRNTQRRRCYFLTVHRDISQPLLASICRGLYRIAGAHFSLVLVRRNGEVQGLRYARVVEREVAFLADPNATDRGDIAGWNALFAEFPLRGLACEADGVAKTKNG